MAVRKNLSEQDKIKIKELYETMSGQKVAKLFGISVTTVKYYGGLKGRKVNTDEERKAKSVVSVSNRRRKLKEELVAYKGGCCERCGYSRYIGALEFHHLDPSQKDFSPSSLGVTRSLEFLKKEVDKCILVCANCHREIHEELRLK